jgi:hypothetical protein
VIEQPKLDQSGNIGVTDLDDRAAGSSRTAVGKFA